MKYFLLILMMLAGPLSAESLTEKAARPMLFAAKGESLAFASDLSDRDKAILKEVIKLSATQMRQPLYYYGSIAYSPDEGLMSEALQSSANHHGVAAADRAALAACNAVRASGTQPCRIGARILPPRYKAQPLELSLGATEAFGDIYRKLRGEKALAVSPATGQFAIENGAGAAARAVAACNAKAQGASDCTVAIAD